MNSLDEANSSMNLGGGEDKQEDQEPEQEKGNSDSTENSAWAGINTGGWSDSAWGYGGFCVLNKSPRDEARV